ncbi:hypothetical protein CY34DRAFT_809968 [Suillus luteus UH-Slu-Lm8-n1]|uniref:Uncharacterized protein n=1 Tax=Suillus luteus UH-Slu-Lm8-n1 TaxID=930992 RepID=A0A0D0A877_9AGAM|nr:hypothetical protein CY34DRAFT_809968 [Suillus luteus UH-Slu-Lm8-n1]
MSMYKSHQFHSMKNINVGINNRSSKACVPCIVPYADSTSRARSARRRVLVPMYDV